MFYMYSKQFKYTIHIKEIIFYFVRFSFFLLTTMILLHSNGGVCKCTPNCFTMNSKLENLDDMVAISKIVALCLIVLFVQAVECLLIEELTIFDHISVRLNMIRQLLKQITNLFSTYNLFSILFYSTKHSLALVIDHLNRQMYPLGYLFIVLRNVKSQRILTCFNLHNPFPYLHDQHLTDYEGT